MKARLHPYIFGALGFVGMIVFYGVLLWFTTGDPSHPLWLFTQKWYLLSPIFLGFGVQMMLFQRLRIIIQKNQLAMAGASASMNGIAMVACCAHHLAEIFPLIGFAGAAVFLVKYQNAFLAISAVINLIGIWYMWSRIHKQKNMHCATTQILPT